MKKNLFRLIMDVDFPDSATACELFLINAAIQNWVFFSSYHILCGFGFFCGSMWYNFVHVRKYRWPAGVGL